MINEKIYLNLLNQFNRVYRHNRQSSIKTRHRYKSAFERFMVFLAEEYRIEKIANVAPKHIYAYTDKLVESGKSIAYVKTELAAIRFWHDKLSERRHDKLPTNEQLNLGRRQFVGINRAWSKMEFARMISKTLELGHDDYFDVLHIARYQAFRIEECFKIDTATAHKALKTGTIEIRGKGGLRRQVPLHPSVRIIFDKRLKVTLRGSKLFVGDGVKTHEAMRRLQNFINGHRASVQDEDSTRPMSFHGLRHLRAAEWYEEYIEQGMTGKQARLAVARLLGHGRDDVTRIYLASLNGAEQAVIDDESHV